MASMTFAPPCIKSPVRSRPSIQTDATPPGASFVAARRTSRFTDEIIDLAFVREPIAVARYFDWAWLESRGGSLPMDWQPPDGRPAIEVKFKGQPTVQQLNHRTCTIRVKLERRNI